MTLRMADGPVANIPIEFNAPGYAVAGYVNDSGIGQTYPGVLLKFPNAEGHLSITTDGDPAMCADVERGAMNEWSGYDYGYCSVSNVNALVAQFGRPRKLWTAHQDPAIGAHICSPACWPGLVTTADGTQWIDHGGAWDESLLADDFFDLAPPQPPGNLTEGENMTNWQAGGQDHVAGVVGDTAYHWWQNQAGTAPPNAPADYYAWHVEKLPLA
jgi:hypothetical protein